MVDSISFLFFSFLFFSFLLDRSSFPAAQRLINHVLYFNVQYCSYLRWSQSLFIHSFVPFSFYVNHVFSSNINISFCITLFPSRYVMTDEYGIRKDEGDAGTAGHVSDRIYFGLAWVECRGR